MKKISALVALALTTLSLPALAVDIPAGRYLIKPSHSGLCLDAGQGSQLRQTACGSATAQQFDISATDGGYARIVSASNGLTVEVSGASNSDGVAIQTAGWTGTNAQQFIFLRNASGYVLKSRQSGKCADLKDWSTSSGGLTQQLVCSGAPNQTFQLVATGGSTAPVADGRYLMRVMHSSLCLDVTNSGTGNGVQLQQYTCNGTAAQQFDVTYVGGSRYEVRNVNSGRCVDLYSAWSFNGVDVQQYDCNQTNAQRWAINGFGDGTVQFASALDLNQVWDVSDVSTAPGADVHIWSNGGAGNQRWWMEPVNYAPNIADGTYSLKAVHSGKCLDVPNSSTAAGTQIQQYTCNNSTAQRFQVVHLGNGYYRIVNVNSGLALHVASFLTGNNAAIQQHEAHGGDNQLFTFVAYGSGYMLKPKASYKCLDVPSASTANGALLQQYTCNQSNAQLFQLQ